MIARWLSQQLVVCFISMCSLDGDNYMYLAGGSSPLLLVNKNISNAGFYDNVVCYNCDSRKVYLGNMNA